MTVRGIARPARAPRSSPGRFRRIAAGSLGSITAIALLSALMSAPSAAHSATLDHAPGEAADDVSAQDPSQEPGQAAGDSTGSADGEAVLFDTEGEGTGLWVVQLDEPSLSTYAGGVEDLEPTSPQVTGTAQLDVEAPASEAYLDHIDRQQDELSADIDDALGRSVDVEFEYSNVINGLAVQVDGDEAERLTELPGVAAVYRDVERELQTDVSHDVIRSASVWDGETAEDVGTRGEGVLVGVIDSGINPSHPSFAATDSEGYTHTNPYGSGNYVGVCDPDHPAHEDICNDKLVGAWNLHPSSLDAQDADGHGSHTASTITGNLHDATAEIGSGEFTRTVQGVAPRANVISYLVCNPRCPGTSSVAAVDQAIEDGVDVLNYSIDGADDPWADIVDRAFLEAFNAGIFVAAAAGNDGPGVGTAVHTGPWNAAVAATTTFRAFVNTLDVTGPGEVPPGLGGLPAAPGTGPDVGEDAGTDIEGELRDAAVVDPGNEEGCQAFPAGAFDDALALIDRGSCTFADKVNNAASAGAVAVAVANNVAGPPTVMGGLESTTIPAVMIENGSGVVLREFMGSSEPDPTAVRLNAATDMVLDDTWQDVVAGFSSRGPSRFDLLAPTFAAPGVDILAATAESDGDPDQYLVNSGTSMASPHGAGAGALLTALHPDWSPAEIRSALASSADTEGLSKEDGTTVADPFDIGSGRLNLDSAGRIGLAMDETHSDFLEANPATGGDPKTLNLPSLVDSDCTGTCSWTRTVTNVAAVEATYNADVTAPDGLSVTVEPSEFTVTPGSTETVEISVDVDTSKVAEGEPAFADVRFGTDAEHANGRPIAAVHYPVVLTPREPEPEVPAITLDPESVTSVQDGDEVVSHTLTVGNEGTADLHWEVREDGALRTPGAAVTRVDTVEPTSTLLTGEQTLTGDDTAGDESSETVIPDRSPAQDGVGQTITHSESQAITAGNSIACTPDEGVTTSDNAFLRTFTLGDFDITGEFDVSEVEFGIENLTAEQELTVNLYTLSDPDAPLTYDNLESIGSATETFQSQELALVTVPVTGVAEAGSTLVVEVSAPDMSGVGGFWPGSNQAGQSAPGYIRSEGCGLEEPADLASIGYPDVHLVMNVKGTTEAPACEVPGGTPWVEVAPVAGTVAPGAEQQVELTFDSAGLSPGTFAANLCLTSDDPDRPLAVVPLTMDVGEVPHIDVKPEQLDVSQHPDTVTEQAVTLGNTGTGRLDWEAFTGESSDCAAPDDVSWLALEPSSGSVAPGASTDLIATVDTAGLAIGEHSAQLCVTSNDQDAPVTAVPVTLTVTDDGEDDYDALHTKLTVDGLADDQMGNAVAIDGDTALVGAFLADVDGVVNQGAAHVYTRTDDGWARETTLVADESEVGLLFGQSVALDGDTAVIGATGSYVGDSRPGAAFVFVRDGDTWTQQARLTREVDQWGADIGASVAVDGDTAVVGAASRHVGDANVQGAAYTFTRDGDEWSAQQELIASDGSSYNNFGTSIGLDGNTMVIGAPNATVDGNFRQGAAYVFTDDGEGWNEQTKLSPSDPGAQLSYGAGVDIDGDTVVVGAGGPDFDDFGLDGSAYIYTRSDDGWAEQDKLTSPGEETDDRFGRAVALDAGTVVIGASHHGARAGVDLDGGAAVVYTNDGDGWTRQLTMTASDTAQGDHLGTSVAVSGEYVLAGAPNATVDGNADQGAAYVFVPGEEAPAPPAIDVSPGTLAPEVPAGETGTEQLSIANSGEQDLEWKLDDGALTGWLRPAGEVTIAGPAEQAPDLESLDGPDRMVSDDGQARDVQTGDVRGGSPAAEPAIDSDLTISHSESMEIVPGNSFVCGDNETGMTRENRFLRTFTLDDFGIEGEFEVDEVAFGVQRVDPAADLEVSLYTLDGAFEYHNLTLLASETVGLEQVEDTLVTVPISATVPAGSTLVMEVAAPDMADVGWVFPGSNSAGQSAPSYISAPDCGAPQPVTFESIGQPDVHLVMAVGGTPLDPISCELPDWLAVDPASGTVAPGERVEMDLAIDTAGLEPGEYTTQLCVTSNDPDSPRTTVPVTLTVTEAGGDPVLTAETRQTRGVWYADLTWTGATSDQVDIYRDGEVTATVDNTGEHSDNLGRPKRGDSFTYRLCEAGTDTCSEPLTIHPRGELPFPGGRP